MEREFEIKNIKGTFRVNIKNGIDALAMRVYIIKIDEGKIEEAYEKILEHIDYNIDKDSWVKVKDGKTFYPAGIENNPIALQELINYFCNYLYEFFTGSNESQTN